jgi:TonB family protein
MAQGSQFDTGAIVVVKSPVVDDWPQPTDFVSVEEQPVVIHFEPPVFPDMAELTGQSGTVWIQALVDAEGHVQKAEVSKPSGSHVGFEEEAVKAAYLNVYKPAIQNGRPVPVWISYRVDFKLR